MLGYYIALALRRSRRSKTQTALVVAPLGFGVAACIVSCTSVPYHATVVIVRLAFPVFAINDAYLALTQPVINSMWQVVAKSPSTFA